MKTSNLIQVNLRKTIRCFFLILFGIIATVSTSYQAKSQVYTASVKIDTNSILLGQQAHLKINVRIPAEILTTNDIFLKWHSFKDTITKNIEIVETTKIDTSLSADKKTILLSQDIIITSFDSGFHVIPPFRFLRNGDSLKYVETQALLLEVRSVEVDTTQAIKDIKSPLNIPFSFKEIFPLLITGIIIISGILLIIYLIRKRKKKNVNPIEKTQLIIPHEKALLLLEEISKKKLWQEGKYKEYYSELTDVLRHYIEERFNISALEQTTEEILRTLRSVQIQNEAKDKLHQILTLADLVKFAKIQPIYSENELSIANGFDFVKMTIPKEEVLQSIDHDSGGNV